MPLGSRKILENVFFLSDVFLNVQKKTIKITFGFCRKRHFFFFSIILCVCVYVCTPPKGYSISIFCTTSPLKVSSSSFSFNIFIIFSILKIKIVVSTDLFYIDKKGELVTSFCSAYLFTKKTKGKISPCTLLFRCTVSSESSKIVFLFFLTRK